MPKIIVTGGLGFIGANFVRHLIDKEGISADDIVILDNHSYAAINQHMVEDVKVYHVDIGTDHVTGFLNHFTDWQTVRVIFNFAAESHVDNSIKGIDPFINSNIKGTSNLAMWCAKNKVPLFHISTDEVYGDTDFTSDKEHIETDVLVPSNPYSATKAAADQMILGIGRTHNLTWQIVRMTNNYGPGQHPEKMVPTIMRSILQGKEIPLYGKGVNIREWLYVEDAAQCIWNIYKCGKKQNIYHIGGGKINRITNKDLAERIIEISDLEAKVKMVSDRPGHDRRYALNSSKMHVLFRDKCDIITYMDLNQGLKTTFDYYSNLWSQNDESKR